VEDGVVAIGSRAVLTRPGHESRRGEVKSLREVLEGLGVEIVLDMAAGSNEAANGAAALCDGGDVLYTGRHLFVGLSSRTNWEGFRAVEGAMGDLVEGVVPVPLPPRSGAAGAHVLHLKSAVTHLDPTTLLVPAGGYGDELVRAMRPEHYGYAAIRLPSLAACNVVVVKNRHVLAQDVPCEVSRRLLEEAARDRGMTISFVSISELAKKDVGLTCCCVLLAI
jgi:dimethylargininase